MDNGDIIKLIVAILTFLGALIGLLSAYISRRKNSISSQEVVHRYEGIAWYDLFCNVLKGIVFLAVIVFVGLMLIGFLANIRNTPQAKPDTAKSAAPKAEWSSVFILTPDELTRVLTAQPWEGTFWTVEGATYASSRIEPHRGTITFSADGTFRIEPSNLGGGKYWAKEVMKNDPSIALHMHSTGACLVRIEGGIKRKLGAVIKLEKRNEDLRLSLFMIGQRYDEIFPMASQEFLDDIQTGRVTAVASFRKKQ